MEQSERTLARRTLLRRAADNPRPTSGMKITDFLVGYEKEGRNLQFRGKITVGNGKNEANRGKTIITRFPTS
jgi:hypothetical protein